MPQRLSATLAGQMLYRAYRTGSLSAAHRRTTSRTGEESQDSIWPLCAAFWHWPFGMLYNRVYSFCRVCRGLQKRSFCFAVLCWRPSACLRCWRGCRSGFSLTDGATFPFGKHCLPRCAHGSMTGWLWFLPFVMYFSSGCSSSRPRPLPGACSCCSHSIRFPNGKEPPTDGSFV